MRTPRGPRWGDRSIFSVFSKVYLTVSGHVAYDSERRGNGVRRSATGKNETDDKAGKIQFRGKVGVEDADALVTKH